jgi:hypothetical protein
MCDAIGHPVDRLRRTRIGPITDRGMRPGQIRDLTPAEVHALVGTGPAPAPAPPRSSKRPPSPHRQPKQR